MELTYWQQCLEYLQEDLPSKQFNTWIRPVQARIDAGELVLLAPNAFVLDHIEKNFLSKIRRYNRSYLGIEPHQRDREPSP